MLISRETKDAILLIVIQGLNYLLPLFTVPYLIFKLGASGYGHIGFAFAYTSYFSMIIEFGFSLSATKRMVEGLHESNSQGTRIFSSTLSAKLLLFFALIIPYWFLPYLVPSIGKYSSTIHAMLPLLIGQTISLSWFFQSVGKIRLYAVITAASRLMILPLIFILIKKAEDYDLAAFIQALATLVSGLVSFTYIFLVHKFKFRLPKIKEISTEIRYSFPLFLSSAATSLYTQFFTLLLGLISSPYIVGLYSAGERIVRTICFSLYSPIVQAFYPKVVRLSIKTLTEAKELCKKLVGFFCFTFGLLGLIIIIFAGKIAHLLGADYAELPYILRILSFTPLIISVGGVFGQMGLVGMGNDKSKRDFKKVYLMSGVVSIALVVPLGFYFLAFGASIALLLTELCVTLLMIYYSKKNKLCFY